MAFTYGKSMTTSELYEEIATTLPPVVYISGKTSTGKSTFARILHDELGYETIGLEDILITVSKTNSLDEGTAFHDVFYDDKQSKAKELYLAATDKIINQHLQSSRHFVIEGAVSNSSMLGRILRPAGNMTVAYFHPEDIKPYVRNLTDRFMQSNESFQGGLPSKFWQHIDKHEFETFSKTRRLTEGLKHSIYRYAQESQQASLVRLHELQQLFDDIIVVSIE